MKYTSVCVYIYIYIYTYVCLTSKFFGGWNAQAMHPWISEVGRLLLFGSGNSWFGVWCPAHCTSSIPLHLAIFSAGFGFGALAVIGLLTFLYFHYPFIPSSAPASSDLLHRNSRLVAYLHERGWPVGSSRASGHSHSEASR